MAKVLKWEEETGADRRSGNQREYLRIESNIEYRVRPISFPVEFDRFYHTDAEGKLHSAIAGKPDECPIRNKYELEPTTRYAINVIDRADGRLKIMEFPFTVYKELRTWKQNTHREPGGGKGTDFLIKKTGSGKKNTKWFCSCIQDVESTPLTEEDLALTDKNSGGSIYNLPEIYAATPLDKIEERLGLIVGSTDNEESGPNVDSVDTVEDNNFEDKGTVDSGFGDDKEPDIGF